MLSRLRQLLIFFSGFFVALMLLFTLTYVDDSVFPLFEVAALRVNTFTRAGRTKRDYTDVDYRRVNALLYRNVRVFCWIMTSPENTQTRAIHVNATWAPLCNKHVFVTAADDSGLPSWPTGLSETRNHLWGKTKRAFRKIYDHELNSYDWFLKADDDTYVVVDNLRFMLLAHSPDNPLYVGCRFGPYVDQGYMSGGSGYVLSRQAVRQLVEQGLNVSADASTVCQSTDDGMEDVLIGKCLEKVGVRAGDSRDALSRHRMLPFSPSYHFDPMTQFPTWYLRYNYYPYKKGEDCCSEYVISFHYVSRSDLYVIHHLLYQTRIFGERKSVAEQLLSYTATFDDSEPSNRRLLHLMRRLSAADAPPTPVSYSTNTTTDSS